MNIRDYIISDMDKSKGILLYGAGTWGKLTYETLCGWRGEKNIEIIFIDRIRGEEYCGEKVIKKEDIKSYPGWDILICTPTAWDEIVNELERQKLPNSVFSIGNILKNAKPLARTNGFDCLSGELLYERYNGYLDRKNRTLPMFPFLNVSVTEACSLNCDKCLALATYYKNPCSFKFEEQEKALNCLLDNVEEIVDMGFVGGEVFVNKEFYKWLEWAISQEKIRVIEILTNGTIIPDRKTINLLKNERVVLGIDDYDELSPQKDTLIELAERESINYYVVHLDYWQDFGGVTKQNHSVSTNNYIFNNCSNKDCFTYLNGRLYRCQREAHLVNLGICKAGEGDFVDLRMENGREELRNKIVNLLTRKEALEACDYCNDISQHMNKIPVAEQRYK